MAEVTFRNVIKSYGPTEVVHGIDLDIGEGEFVVLVGPSGCGKSTSLRMLAGLEEVTAGEIAIGGRVVNEVAPRDRDIAMVFQDYALYPHMTVFENMAFSLRYRKTPKGEIRSRVDEAAGILGLTPLLDRSPKQLSGGQRQRVAMGRAIVRKPHVFLFDEPLSNLDAKLRGSMRLEIRRLHRSLGVTTVYVTHDQIEAMTLADRVVVMHNGRIDQIGTPTEVYNSPRTRFVAGFIGSPPMNFLAVRPDEGGLVIADGDFRIPLPPRLKRKPDGPAELGLRPEDIEIATVGADEAGRARLPATVDLVEELGADTLVFCTVAGTPIAARLRPGTGVEAGQDVVLLISMDRAHLFDGQSGDGLT